jgi:predicted NodU family carbamoyl transferase
MKNNHIYVLGTGYSHDGSACLLKDGKIAVAIEKERITRVKHDGNNDTVAIQYCLDAAGITIHDVDLVVQNGAAADPVTDYYEGPRLFTSDVNVPVHNISHHLAHAYSTIGTCPFDKDFNIMIIDGAGSSFDQCDDLTGYIPDVERIAVMPHMFYEKDSYYSYKAGRMQTVYKDFSEFGHFFRNREKYTGNMHSIGGVYEMFSKYCFSNIEDTGKLMGLGPYGQKGKITDPLFNLKDGRVFVNYNTVNTLNNPSRSFANLKKNFQYYADVAYWVQEEVEKAMLYTFESRLQENYAENICFAGGVALNAVGNAKLLDKLNIRQLYMQPAAADNGIAIGCAYYGWLEILKKERVKHNGSAFFGKTYSEEEVTATVEGFLIYDPLEAKALIDTFLNSIRSYDKNKNLSGKVMQISIPDIGVYQLFFDNGTITVHHELKAAATSGITVDSRYFLNGMKDMAYFNHLVNEGKLTISNHFEIQDIVQAVDFSGKAAILNNGQLQQAAGRQPFVIHKPADFAKEVATLLAEGKVIGLYRGGAEFGPRALGHRSIIADPRTPGIRDYINQRIKLREDFRPFAPAVLEEDLLVYFKKQQDTPYMILVNEIREEWKEQLESVIHKNDSARVQTVNREWNPEFYNILSAFKALTGISVLLNTSFNRKGMPIVETPGEALEFFFASELDYVIIEDMIIRRRTADDVHTSEVLADALAGTVPA